MRPVGDFQQFLKTGEVGAISVGASVEEARLHLGRPLEANRDDWLIYGILQLRQVHGVIDLIGFYYTVETEVANAEKALNITALPLRAPERPQLETKLRNWGVDFELSTQWEDLSFCSEGEYVLLLASGVKIFGRDQHVFSFRIETPTWAR